jgi:hypothetical protein
MRPGAARAHLTNSLSVSLRVGKGVGKQNSLMLRDAASCCISTETAPCAKPWQKLIAALASAARLGIAQFDEIACRPGGEIGFRDCVSGAGGKHQKERHASGPVLAHHGSAFASFGNSITSRSDMIDVPRCF